MSTPASTYDFLSQQSDDFMAAEPWSIDRYADGLMDELFADLDRAVEVESKQPIATIEPKFVQMSAVKIPASASVTTTEVRPVRSTSGNPAAEQIAVSANSSQSPTVVKKARKSRNWVGQVLTWGAAVGIAVAGILAVQNAGLFNRLSGRSLQLSLQSDVGVSQVGTLTQEDLRANLANYMLDAMATIERNQAKAIPQTMVANNVMTNNAIAGQQLQQQTVAMASNSGVPLPPPTTAGNVSPATARSTVIIERNNYIPVYQAPLPMRYAPPAIPGTNIGGSSLPPVPKAGNTVATKPATKAKLAANPANGKIKMPQPMNVLSAVRPNLKPIKVQNQPINLAQPKPPKISIARFNTTPVRLPVAKAPVKTNVAPTTQVAVAPTSPNIVLEGVLDFGAKSGALFNVNGVTRQIQIGESIGSTGWTLVEANATNKSAVIRRNGEVRAIDMGQKF